VEAVLTEIGARREGGAPLIEAWNKIDLPEPEEVESIRAEAARREDVIVISAVTGEGVDALLDCATVHLRKGSKIRRITLPADAGEAIAWLHANGEVLTQRSEGMETEFEVRLSEKDWARFQARQEQRA
jgi:GTP-binding protein HflX